MRDYLEITYPLGTFMPVKNERDENLKDKGLLNHVLQFLHKTEQSKILLSSSPVLPRKSELPNPRLSVSNTDTLVSRTQRLPRTSTVSGYPVMLDEPRGRRT